MTRKTRKTTRNVGGGEVFFGVGFLAVPWSRHPVVSSSRGLVGAPPSHSQAFPAILSHSQPITRHPVIPCRPVVS